MLQAASALAPSLAALHECGGARAGPEPRDVSHCVSPACCSIYKLPFGHKAIDTHASTPAAPSRRHMTARPDRYSLTARPT